MIMRKLKLTFFTALFSTLGLFAQIPNGGFESWTTVSNDWHLTHFRGAGDKEDPTHPQKYQPGHSGNYAVKLISGTNQDGGVDLSGALASWKPNPSTNGGGFPCTQKPSKISFYAKHELAVGDSATVWVYFIKNGVMYPALDQVNLNNNNFFLIGGTSTDWKYYEFNIKGLTVTPDTVFYAITSGNLKNGFDNNTTAKAGSYIVIDDVNFDTGAAPHGDFEEWGRPVEYPNNYMMWGAYEVVVDCNTTNPLQKTTDAHSGSYAMKATTYSNPYWSGNQVVGQGTFGDLINNKETKFLFSQKTGTFRAWYKYIPTTTDTASINVTFYKNGVGVGYVGKNLYAVSNYSGISIPFYCSEIPDSAQIRFNSSNVNLPKNLGSTLYLDDISFEPDVEWHNYDANLTPDNDGWSKSSVITPTIPIANPSSSSIVGLLCCSDFKYLSCVSDSTHANGYEYGSELMSNTPLTVMLRAKSSVQSGPKLGGYFEIDYGPSYQNTVLKFKWNTSGATPFRYVSISNAAATGTAKVDFDSWHIYRITFDGDSLRLYIDEANTPVIRAKPYLASPAKTTTYALKIVGSSISNFASGDIDWISWNYKGAFAPGQGVLPTSYITTDIEKTSGNNNTIGIYPNPASNTIRLNGTIDRAKISISDINSRTVLTQEIAIGEDLNISALPQGIYIVKIEAENGVSQTKLIKK